VAVHHCTLQSYNTCSLAYILLIRDNHLSPRVYIPTAGVHQPIVGAEVWLDTWRVMRHLARQPDGDMKQMSLILTLAHDMLLMVYKQWNDCLGPSSLCFSVGVLR
jgi:hypothetical protein